MNDSGWGVSGIDRAIRDALVDLDLFESSTAVSSEQGRQWFVVADRQGAWWTWNDRDLVANHRFDTRDKALASIPPGNAK